jgi:hypothetical protein
MPRFIYWNIPSFRRGEISADFTWEKIYEKRGKCKRNRKKGERKFEERGKGKKMLNREKIKTKRPQKESKNNVSREGEKYHFERGGRINIIFGPKYRPLVRCEFIVLV